MQDDLSGNQAFDSLVNNLSDNKGLFTTAGKNRINDVWELSDHIKLDYNGNHPEESLFYVDSSNMEIKKCDICVIVVDKENGELINKSEFILYDGTYSKVK